MVVIDRFHCINDPNNEQVCRVNAVLFNYHNLFYLRKTMKDLDKALMLDHHYSNTVPIWVNLITDQLYFRVQQLCRIIISSRRKSIYISENGCVKFNMNYVTTDLMIFTVVPNKNKMKILSSIFSVQFLCNLRILCHSLTRYRENIMWADGNVFEHTEYHWFQWIAIFGLPIGPMSDQINCYQRWYIYIYIYIHTYIHTYIYIILFLEALTRF